MKIKINDIPKDGLELTESQGAGALDLARDDLRFVSPVDISAFISRDKDEVYARITTKGKLEITCARCLSPDRIDFKKDFDLSYDVKGKTSLDLTDDIRQEIVLECPLKPLCRQDCKGLCPVCGKNLNEGSCGHKSDSQKWSESKGNAIKEE
ncbi:MAG: DUF177 domain-containing protein [Candidatus Omnitrophota bacterium]|nr:DUF177 domain-containing protein [Candidatus Omnitrophota bacterium]